MIPVSADARTRRARAPAGPAPAWTIDPAASRVTFASSFNGTAFTGTFRRWNTQIRFDPRNLAGSSVRATIDVASAVTGSADRDQSLPSADWFSAQAHPQATFTATNFTAVGPNRYRAAGVLNIRGVARPLTLPFTLVITGQGAQQRARMNASIGINRLAFGIGQGQWATGEVVPARVDVSVQIAARRAP
jgi:polyisoprenoid-binding protein YceI